MTTFRVTQNMLVDRSVSSMQLGLSRLARAQEQLSTGRVINRPSDSPIDTTVAMRLRSARGDAEQFARNAADGSSRLTTVDRALSSVTLQVRRARELGLQGASTGTTSATARGALATEIDQLRAGLLSDANTVHQGRPVFGGITAGSTAYAADGTFVGVDGEISRAVADGVRVRVDVSGTEVFGPSGASVFDDLAALSTALRAGDEAGIRAGLASLQTGLTRISSVQAEVGAVQNRLEAAEASAQDSLLTLTTSLSEIENVDLTKATIELKMQEVAYQAALASTARVMQPSLLDFLR